MEKSELIAGIKALEEKVYRKELTLDNFRELPQPYQEYFGQYLISYKIYCKGTIDKKRLEWLRRETLYTNLLSELEELHGLVKPAQTNEIISTAGIDSLIQKAKQEEERNSQMYKFYQDNIKRSGTVPAEILRQLQSQEEPPDYKALFLEMCDLYSAMVGDVNKTFYNSVKNCLEKTEK